MTSDHSDIDPPRAAHPTPVIVNAVPVVQGQGHGRAPASISQQTLPRHRRRAPIVIGMVGVLTLLAAALWHWWSNDPVNGHYKTVTIDRGPITALVTATGAVNPVISVQVGSQVSGKIAKLYADFNSVVREGQILASIDQKPYQAKVSQAKAALKSAQAGLAKARNMLVQKTLELNRMAALRKEQFVAQADLDLARTNARDAEAQVDVSDAQVDQAKATLASAELDLGYTTIFSPVNGTVVSRNVEEGQTVVASFQTPTLFVLAQDLTHMQVIANVSESDIGGVTEGKSADFRVDAYPRESFHGIVTQVRNAPVSIQNVVTYDVIISVDNPDLKLKPGMTANITIVTARNEDALRAPNAALRFRMPGVAVDRKTPQLWVLDASGHVRSVPVSLGIADSLYTDITSSDVHEGESAIVGLATAEDTAQEKLPPGFEFGPKMR
ncbi:MAG: efflux RND transporter periplasmic adaptor subunit [Nitrospira sp.]|nr:efflux RND transporter periplasmic adaptor subunit [Nitrospira sp.]MCW5794647.1 efflux RND transporter periplasmic adaptor subunit [Nitrospira sp.]HMU29321.1 efflux RND transporter periplasmic adaptor subunit [Nitrospira sp.]HMV56979.1 efflux RND transporter periplasmic adaptor subunit [Nitrospira sp.]HMW87773.1 efflux RND transporter periplasmic adaptor subunit [Nitrospira sp.]